MRRKLQVQSSTYKLLYICKENWMNYYPYPSTSTNIFIHQLQATNIIPRASKTLIFLVNKSFDYWQFSFQQESSQVCIIYFQLCITQNN
jgi:hypothetical protein